MKIVVMSWLERESAEIFIRRNVVHRPDLATKPMHLVAAELSATNPDVVVLREDDVAAVATLQDVLPHCRFIVCGLVSSACNVDHARLCARCMFVTAPTWQAAEYESFVLAESLGRPRHEPRPLQRSAASEEVMLVGAGVVNLVTALALRARGHEVSVYDRMSDPALPGDHDCGGAGATFGGKDARIYSYNESRHHLARAPWYADGGAQFRRQIAHDGWLSRPYETLGDEDRDWIRELEDVPPWSALQYGNDIIGFNKASDRRWRELFSIYPELLQGTHYIGRLLRIYQSESSLQAGRRAEAEIGALIRPLELRELVSREPALAEAVEKEHVAGALEVRGFSIGVQTFSRNLIAMLQRSGVRFHWQHELSEIRCTPSGDVAGLVINGALRQADHYVVCPGANARSIRGRGAALTAIGAMVGMWVTLPNDGAPLSSPLKVGRRGPGSTEAAQGANVIPALDADAGPVLHCSCGHGFIGVTPNDVSWADLPELARCLIATAQELFGDKFQRARALGWIDGVPRCCIRPWTPSGLGILDVQDTRAGGRLVIAGGHNTGGFAQSPEVAQAVVCALEGKPHAMHTLYHPRRFVDVFEAASPGARR